MTEPQHFALQQIGVVRSLQRTPETTPAWGAPATIEVAPQFAAGLDGIERSSHLYVIAFMHRADRGELQTRPRRLAPAAPAIGVFASRSPARPNPVALTVCRLLQRAGLRLDVDALDLCDGTPIIDLKPYNPGWDTVACATRERRVQPTALTDHQLLACLRRALACHLGELAIEPSARTALVAAFVASRRFAVDVRDPRLRAAVNRFDLTTDALLGLLGATLTGGRLYARAATGPLRIAIACGRDVLLFEETVATASQLATDDPTLLVHALRIERCAVTTDDGAELQRLASGDG